MSDVTLTPNASDLTALHRMFTRFRDEGRKEFAGAIAWTAWFVGRSVAAQTEKCRERYRDLLNTEPSDPKIQEAAARSGRSPGQMAGWYKWYVERFSRDGSGSKYVQLLDRDDNLERAVTIRRQGFSRNTWLWMARSARRQAELRQRLFTLAKSRDVLNPGFEFTNKVAWMHRIVGNLSGVFQSADRAVGHYFEGRARKAARAAGATA